MSNLRCTIPITYPRDKEILIPPTNLPLFPAPVTTKKHQSSKLNSSIFETKDVIN